MKITIATKVDMLSNIKFNVQWIFDFGSYLGKIIFISSDFGKLINGERGWNKSEGSWKKSQKF